MLFLGNAYKHKKIGFKLVSFIFSVRKLFRLLICIVGTYIAVDSSTYTFYNTLKLKAITIK